MSEWALELLPRAQHHFAEIRPLLPTYTLLVVSAVFPIYAGAHASLHRPISAAKPSKKQKKDGDDDGGIDLRLEEDTQLAAGLEMSDVLLYPLLAGAMLSGLYYLIKYLDDPAIISKILNWYLSVFGLYGVATFLSDSVGTVSSYIFPDKYFHEHRVWIVDGSKRLVLPQKMGGKDVHPGVRHSPLPASLSKLPLPNKVLWWLRDLVHKPALILDLQILKETLRLRPTSTNINAAGAAIAVVVYFNLVGPPWWMTNLLGFSFTYSAFQMMSPTTFSIGTLLLTGLFFYDIYMVFYTPMMITVASKLDIPAKLIFPKPETDLSKSQYAMLGLGDIVIPGIVIALALRFDLYMYYLRRQKPMQKTTGIVASRDNADSKLLVASVREYQKETYVRVTGTWGDRFWLGRRASQIVGGQFPKSYFNAAMAGYVMGLILTVTVMHVFQHGQPALLYLVPCVLGAIWTTALARQELKILWKYTEDADDARKVGLDSAAVLISHKGLQLDREGNTTQDTKIPSATYSKGSQSGHGAQTHADGASRETDKAKQGENHRLEQQGSADETSTEGGSKASDQTQVSSAASTKKQVNRRIFSLAISLPPPASNNPESFDDVPIKSDA